MAKLAFLQDVHWRADIAPKGYIAEALRVTAEAISLNAEPIFQNVGKIGSSLKSPKDIIKGQREWASGSVENRRFYILKGTVFRRWEAQSIDIENVAAELLINKVVKSLNAGILWMNHKM